MERELGAVQSSSSDLFKRANSGSVDSDDAIKSIEVMIGRVENLKRKVRLTPLVLDCPFLTSLSAFRPSGDIRETHSGSHAGTAPTPGCC